VGGCKIADAMMLDVSSCPLPVVDCNYASTPSLVIGARSM
jgi:hypothetical protein